MESSRRTRVLILAGGFAGLTVAMELERKLGRDRSVEITLVNRENFFLFTPCSTKWRPVTSTSRRS